VTRASGPEGSPTHRVPKLRGEDALARFLAADVRDYAASEDRKHHNEEDARIVHPEEAAPITIVAPC
jgi:hypothetical protein